MEPFGSAQCGARLFSRGGGTSLAGECCNTAVVLDWSRYCNRLLSVGTDNRRCVVEPGIMLDDLNRQLAAYGLQYGPRPATHPNCTLGGMIGNNSCGSTAQAYGKVVDNLHRLEVLTYGGSRLWVGRTSEAELERLMSGGGREAELHRGMVALRDRYAGQIRERYPDIPRRVSGLDLDSLLPERGFDVAGLLTGSESTLVTVLRAELELVPVHAPRARGPGARAHDAGRSGPPADPLPAEEASQPGGVADPAGRPGVSLRAVCGGHVRHDHPRPRVGLVPGRQGGPLPRHCGLHG